MAREVAAHDGYGPPELSSLSLSDTFAAAPVATPSISCQLNAETSPLCKEGLPLTYIVAGEEYTLTIAASQQGVYKTAVSLRVEDAIQATQSQEAVRDWQANHNQTPMLEIDAGNSKHIRELSYGPACSDNLLELAVFEWNPQQAAYLSLKINCLSTDFTSGKGGQRGVTLLLQCDTKNMATDTCIHSSACSLKVFSRRNVVKKRLQTDLEKATKDFGKKGPIETVKTPPTASSASAIATPPVTVFFPIPSTHQLPQIRPATHATGVQAIKPEPLELGLGLVSPNPSTSQYSQYSTVLSPSALTLDPRHRSERHQSHSPVRDVDLDFCDLQRELVGLVGLDYSTTPQPLISSELPLSEGKRTEGLEAPLSNATSTAQHTLPTLAYGPETTYRTAQRDQRMHMQQLSEALPPMDESQPQGANFSQPIAVDISAEASALEVQRWLTANHFGRYLSAFEHYTGAVLLSLEKSDLVAICGSASGIRMHHLLHSMDTHTDSPKPALTMSMWTQTEDVDLLDDPHAAKREKQAES
eukprot:m.64557 g.64557  ORF g.64557 m.64557 type:complete len:529 (-) comp14005_c0_seq3:79-1665(-)